MGSFVQNSKNVCRPTTTRRHEKTKLKNKASKKNETRSERNEKQSHKGNGNKTKPRKVETAHQRRETNRTGQGPKTEVQKETSYQHFGMVSFQED